MIQKDNAKRMKEIQNDGGKRTKKQMQKDEVKRRRGIFGRMR